MSASKHTPGPWSFLRSKAPVDGEYDFAISGEGAPVLAEVFGRFSNGGYSPAEDNARLIAAAPELLDALRNLVAVQPNLMANSAELANARAAIAKADGRA